MILVIKLSGKVLEKDEQRSDLCQQLAQIQQQGHRLVIVHGGGQQLNELSQRMGIPIVQHAGRRVTDKTTLEMAIMVFSSINRTLVASLLTAGVSAVGISAFDGGLSACHRRPPIPVDVSSADGKRERQSINFGFVGEIEGIQTTLLEGFWRDGHCPVVNCLGADKEGQILNINADTLAAELAVALQAARLISVSDVTGIYFDLQDPSSLIPELDTDQAYQYLAEGRFTNGMVPKIESALGVLGRGVDSVQIVSGLQKSAIVESLAGKAGTLLRRAKT